MGDVLSDDPQFLRFSERGKVHVMRGYRRFAEGIVDDPGPSGWLWAKQEALCGVTGAPGGMDGISAFPDEDLCGTCRRNWPHAPELLFEHRLSYEEDDDG